MFEKSNYNIETRGSFYELRHQDSTSILIFVFNVNGKLKKYKKMKFLVIFIKITNIISLFMVLKYAFIFFIYRFLCEYKIFKEQL